MGSSSASLEALLVFLEGENAGAEIKIQSPREYLIGRSEQCDIFIGEKKVSRKHAKLTASKDGLFLEDLESTNGTFVEGRKISNAKLKDGETVRIGMTVFKVNMFEGRALSKEGELVSDPGQPQERLDLSENSSKEFDSSENALSGPKENSGIDLDKLGATMDAGDAVEFPSDERFPEPSMPSGEAPLEDSKASSKSESLSQSKRKPLTGDLSEMALPDILQMLKNNQRSGVLKIAAPGAAGEVFFKSGELIDVKFGKISGLKAIYRLLSLQDGGFELEPLPKALQEESSTGEIDLPLENILLEGMRQLDEMEKIKKGLPSYDAALEINSACTSPLSKLHPRVLDILQLVINLGVFSDVLDKSELSDLETSKIIYYLLKKGYIKPVE